MTSRMKFHLNTMIPSIDEATRIKYKDGRQSIAYIEFHQKPEYDAFERQYRGDFNMRSRLDI